jgi:phosphoglycolate phosphatase
MCYALEDAGCLGNAAHPAAKVHQLFVRGICLCLVLACKQLDLDPSAVLFVGDDLRDIESGRAAGSRTAAVRYGYIHPEANPSNWGADVVVDHPLEHRKVLDRAICSC